MPSPANGTTLHAALIEARKAIPAIPKTAKNPHFGNSYAPLGTILEAVLPALHEQGLSLTARVEISGGGQPVLEVLIAQRDGDAMLASQVPLIGATDMQKLGGAMTYALRYAVGSLLALELEDDDDGNRASQPAPQAPQRAATPPRAAQETRSAPPPASGAWDGRSCPKCGKPQVSQIKTGKNAGLWECRNWPDKGWDGCRAKWTSKEAVAAEWARLTQPTPQPTPGGDWTEEVPPPGDDDLPF